MPSGETARSLNPRRPDQEARANSAGDSCRIGQSGRLPEKPDRFTCELLHRELHIRDSGALDAEMKRQMGRLRKEPCRWPIHATNSSSADDQLKNLCEYLERVHLRRFCDRRLRSSHRRLARLPNGACKLRARRAGTSASRTATSTWWPGAPFRQGFAIRQYSIHRAPC